MTAAKTPRKAAETAAGPVQFDLNPDDPFDKVIIEMLEMNRRKRNDYAGTDHPFQNFYDSAYQLNSTAGDSVETLIATKQSRLRVIRKPGHEVSNEGLRDTILDRAVYSVIALGILDEGGYSTETPEE